MLLAFNEADLDAYVVTVSEESESDIEDYDEDNDLAPTSKKRKAPTKAIGLKASCGRLKKQAKTSVNISNRLFFRLRSRETSEEVIFSNLYKGHLDFIDSKFVAFKGVSSMLAVSSAVLVKRFKVRAEAATTAEP
jgi:hypothetical protein